MEVEPYSVAEVQRILEQAGQRRNSARWAIALALGLRQGEALGLKLEHVDLDKHTLRVRRNRLRPKYAHGCEDKPCGKEAGYCPRRERTNEDTDDTKSAAGRRVMGLPASVVQLLRDHREVQDRERQTARQLWEEEGWVFTSPTGRPLNPNTDYHEWKRLLRDAGVRNGRLHDARHTAATVLLLLGVQERAAMDIMGWATTGMAARYQHVTDPVRADIAKRVGALIWQANNHLTNPQPPSALICPKGHKQGLHLTEGGSSKGDRKKAGPQRVRPSRDQDHQKIVPWSVMLPQLPMRQ
uniref:tyrosine-type recombinase/integrase n=1 Tax=Actinoplanes sandaracinus TaxID=3045177 RepID=UPI002E22DD31